MVHIFKRGLSVYPEFGHTRFPLQTGHIIQNRLDLIGIQVHPLDLKRGNSFFDLFICLDDIVFGTFNQQLCLHLQAIAFVIYESSVVEDRNGIGSFHLVDKMMSGSNKLLEENSRYRYNSFSDTHFSL
jgi:hypothetical protein